MTYGALKATLRQMFWAGFWLGFVQGAVVLAVLCVLALLWQGGVA